MNTYNLMQELCLVINKKTQDAFYMTCEDARAFAWDANYTLSKVSRVYETEHTVPVMTFNEYQDLEPSGKTVGDYIKFSTDVNDTYRQALQSFNEQLDFDNEAYTIKSTVSNNIIYAAHHVIKQINPHLYHRMFMEYIAINFKDLEKTLQERE